MNRQRLVEAAGPQGGGNGPMEPGDIRTILVKDSHGTVTKTLTLRRTTRDYVYDLCDAYNDGRIRDDVEWFVNNGTLQLGTPKAWTDAHTERLKRSAVIEQRRWKAGQDAAEKSKAERA